MTINSKQFQEICDGVWRDRATLLKRRGSLDGEATLMRAVYFRLSTSENSSALDIENDSSPRAASSYKMAVTCLLEVHGRPRFNGIEWLKELAQRYKQELREK